MSAAGKILWLRHPSHPTTDLLTSIVPTLGQPRYWSSLLWRIQLKILLIFPYSDQVSVSRPLVTSKILSNHGLVRIVWVACSSSSVCSDAFYIWITSKNSRIISLPSLILGCRLLPVLIAVQFAFRPPRSAITHTETDFIAPSEHTRLLWSIPMNVVVMVLKWKKFRTTFFEPFADALKNMRETILLISRGNWETRKF